MADTGEGKSETNVIIMMADDMGYSDIGCYGSEIATPQLDALAAGGVRLSQMYNCARCCPTRASLLTGLYPHQAGLGHMVNDHGTRAYQGFLRRDCVTIAEVLRGAGYRTWLSGKWHVGGQYGRDEASWRCAGDARHPTPRQRGFDRFFGMLGGAGSFFHTPMLMEDDELLPRDQGPDFYFTDAIGERAAGFIDEACDAARPFFGYVAFTAPHWPLHAWPADIAPYRGRYREGWDVVRARRHARLIELGLLGADSELSPRDAQAPAWEDVAHPDWEAQRMAVYAAQVSAMDRAVGRIVEACRHRGVLDDTLILFLSDNGGCAEFLKEDGENAEPARGYTPDGRRVRSGNSPEIEPGPDDTFASYDLPWANASNAPFRYYKHWVHEGGIATPLIAHWPSGGLRAGAILHEPAHVIDLLPTACAAAGAAYPQRYGGEEIQPVAGVDLLPLLRGEDFARETPIFWEHEGNCAVRDGHWKLVRARKDGDWELYDMASDRSELHDLAGRESGRVAAMRQDYDAWAERCEVRPWPLAPVRA